MKIAVAPRPKFATAKNLTTAETIAYQFYHIVPANSRKER